MNSATVIDILKMGRIHFLVSGLILYMLGSLYAVALGTSVTFPQWIWGYIVLMCGHLSVSYSNDHFDSKHDRMGAQTPFSGGSGVLQRAPHLEQLALLIALALIALSILIGTAFVLYYGFNPVFIVFIIAGNMLGYFYTAPPLSLSYRGYGEIATTIAVGIVVPIMGYICANGISSIEIAGLLIPSVIYGLVFILTVEIPDMEDDAQGNKRTFVAVYGRHAAVRIIAACCIVASIVFSLFTVLPIVPALIDYRLVAGLTAIPLAAAVSGVMRMPTSKHSSVPFVMRSMTSLVAFTALFDAYLVITVL